MYVCMCARGALAHSRAVAEECIVHSAVGPHKHDTREEKHIFPSWEARGEATPLVPLCYPPGRQSPSWATALTASPPFSLVKRSFFTQKRYKSPGGFNVEKSLIFAYVNSNNTRSSPH